jgi:acyl-CoA synthetase (AMP-forming)/AMP-acid ligase II/acyl carrier protein
MADVFPDLIRAIARHQGDRIALVVDGTDRLTYRELVERAATVATGLRARGVRHGDLVALLFPNVAWLDYACALLGVLNAGAAAVVLADGITADELRHIAGHCELRAVLTGRPRQLPAVADWQDDLAAVEATGAASPSVEGAAEVRPGDLAMVLHTSGTTGRPKGVPLTHAHLVTPALQSPPKADPGVAERVVAPFPIATAAGQMYVSRELGCANTLYLMPEFEAGRFCALIDREHIDRVSLAPAMGRWLVRSGQHEKITLTTPWSVTFASAPLPVSALGKIQTLFPNARLENLYSSTELIPGVMTTVVDPARPNSVGKPFDVFELRITDEAGAALPAYAHGEVRMRVPGIAGRRYLGDDAASARTFDGDWVRTGDLGYLDGDGYLYLEGRVSDVLNPGGRKVAPSEVEAVLDAHPAVTECAVFGLRHAVLDELVAAAVVTQAPVTASELKRFARERLSDYKVPAVIGFVTSLPRTEIGKVQRPQLEKLLLEPDAASPGSTRGTSWRDRPASPHGVTEQRLASLWRSLLDLDSEPAGPDNFFALGGHSLATAQLVLDIEATFGVRPTMLDLFDQSTLSEQAAYLDALGVGPAAPAADGPKPERLADDTVAPWSYLQEYMWTAKQRCPNPGWNVLLSIGLRGPVEVVAVRDAIAFLVRRHEVLRTRLDETGQQVDEAAPIELPVTALSAANPRDQLAGIARAQHRICVDLRHGPAVVPRLVRIAADEHVLLLTMDHASCDGWSAGIVLREFAAAYDALTADHVPHLPPLPLRYRDFAAYQRRLVAAGAFEPQLGYWQRQLAGWTAEPVLPRRPDAPASPGYRSGLRELAIEPRLAGAVRNLAASDGSTVFAVLLGVLMASIAEVSGRTDIVVATLSAGRHHPDLAGVVGMFANPLLLRADVAAAGTHRDLFDIVRTALASAHDHGAVPFPVVAQRARPGADRPEVWFNMAPPITFPQARNVTVEPAELPRNYVIEVPAAAWRGENLLVNGLDTGTSIRLEFDYNTALVQGETIDRLCASYLGLLRAVTT